MHRIDKTKRLHERLDRYDRRRYTSKRRWLREDLIIGEKVFILAERIKKKELLVSFISNLSKKFFTLIKR